MKTEKLSKNDLDPMFTCPQIPEIANKVIKNNAIVNKKPLNRSRLTAKKSADILSTFKHKYGFRRSNPPKPNNK